jgi:hypothetical protein
MANLKETKIIYKRTDFYFQTEIENKTFLGFLNDRDIGFADDDKYIIVQKRHEFRPYVLAFDLYGKDEYAWIFPRMNMDILKDPIRDMIEGIVLRVPTPERALEFFA